MKNLGKYLISVAVIISLVGCVFPQRDRAGEEVEEQEKSDYTEIAKSKADSLLRGLTLEEKVGQLFMPALYASSDYFTIEAVREYSEMGIGGIILLKGDSRSATILADTMLKQSKIRPFIAIDAEWGLGMRLTDAPRYPSSAVIGKTATESEMFDYGAEVARECRERGINVVLGPVLDVVTKNSFIGSRSYGSDPQRVADLAVAYARGLESGGVMSVAKHFPGHGSAMGDTHKEKSVIDRSLHDMDSVDLYPFRQYIEQDLSAVMVGHLAVPAIDPEMLPAAVSKTVITDLLRRDLEFHGLVLTDALNMAGAEGYGADKAILAGADIVLAPVNTCKEISRVMSAIAEGRITESEIDNRVYNILFHKVLLSLGRKQKNTPHKAG